MMHTESPPMDCAGSGWRRVWLVVILFRPLTPPGLPSPTGPRKGTLTDVLAFLRQVSRQRRRELSGSGDHFGARMKKDVSRLHAADRNQPPLDFKKQPAQRAGVL